MSVIFDDKDICPFCKAYWHTDGYCTNGHPNLEKGTKPLNPVKIIEMLKKDIEKGKEFDTAVIITVAQAEVILLCLENLFPDNCEICKGQNGGVRGNENIVDGKRVCDYCG